MADSIFNIGQLKSTINYIRKGSKHGDSLLELPE